MEELNLVEILKDCPKGTKLWSPLFGNLEFEEVKDGMIHISYIVDGRKSVNSFVGNGHYYKGFRCAECLLFPSKENRDWSTFKVAKPKFDITSLQPFDKVLVRDKGDSKWRINLFSNIDKEEYDYPFVCLRATWSQCIPYNDDTKHLIGTTNKAPDFYVTWDKE